MRTSDRRSAVWMIDFDVFTLVAARIQKRAIAQFGQQTAQLRLKNDEHREGGEGQRNREESSPAPRSAGGLPAT